MRSILLLDNTIYSTITSVVTLRFIAPISQKLSAEPLNINIGRGTIYYRSTCRCTCSTIYIVDLLVRSRECLQLYRSEVRSLMIQHSDVSVHVFEYLGTDTCTSTTSTSTTAVQLYFEYQIKMSPMNTHYCTRPVLRCYHNNPDRTTISELRLLALSQNQDRAIQLSPRYPLMWGLHIRALRRAQLGEHYVLLRDPQGVGSPPAPLVPRALPLRPVLVPAARFGLDRSPVRVLDLATQVAIARYLCLW